MNSGNRFGQIEILNPSCNLGTLQDGRGGIFSWVPDLAIKEFTLLYFNAGKVRGNHFHPEFVEYFLVIEGSLSLTTYDELDGRVIVRVDSQYFRPTEVPHLKGDFSKAKRLLNWEPTFGIEDVIEDMVESELRRTKRD